ncbi:MAG: ATP-binding cassette domain-containing protein [Tepidiformaceae bacterium]
MPTNVIAANGVTFSYGERRALDGLTLVVPEGSTFGLLGPNGSGKSTFVSLLAAMEKPQGGALSVFGEPPAAKLRARVGTVFQENALDPLMSANEILRLAGRLFGLPADFIRERSTALLRELGLEGREEEKIARLSGGMRRRLEICRALLHNPDLLLLDEPTTGVDPDERRALWSTLLERKDGARTILLATNDLKEADDVCDYVAFLQGGRVVAIGTPAELKKGLKRESVRVSWASPSDAHLETLANWADGGEVAALDGTVHITVDDASSFVPRLFALAPGEIRSISIETASLEDAYFQHVSRRLPVPAGGPT